MEEAKDLFAARTDDDREVGPHDIIDCLQGFIDRGECVDLVVVMEDKETGVHMWATDMRKTEIVGLLEYAKIGFAHAEQHFSDEEGGGEE